MQRNKQHQGHFRETTHHTTTALAAGQRSLPWPPPSHCRRYKSLLPLRPQNTHDVLVPSSESSVLPPPGEYEGRSESDSLPGMAGGSGDEVVELGCGGAGGDPGAYAAVLKRKLDFYCAAVAKSMEAKSQESSWSYPNSQASNTSHLISQASFDGDGDKATLFTNSHVIDNIGSQGKPANCGTYKEQSDDDGDFEETTDPGSTKKMRRMLSNRESARRSRKRKQTHLNDLESKVSRLTDENASLLKRLADMTQKYNDATLDNQNLTVNVEMMRRKVHIAEEAVQRVTGASMMLLSDMPGSSLPLSSCASDAASAAVPVKDNMLSFLQLQLQDDQLKLDLSNATIPLKNEEIHAMPTSLRRVASLEHLQKKILKDSVHCGSSLPLSDPKSPEGIATRLPIALLLTITVLIYNQLQRSEHSSACWFCLISIFLDTGCY